MTTNKTNETKGTKGTKEIKEIKEIKTTPEIKKPETTTPEIKTITLGIGYISSGKPSIISFYNKRQGGKQLETSPFQTKPETGDGYYNYSYHFDLREGKGDLERLQKRFPDLKSYEQLIKEEGFKNLRNTKTGYGLYTRQYFYNKIKNGEMDIKGKNSKGEEILLKIEWIGGTTETDEMEKSTMTFDKEIKNKKDKQPKQDLLEGLEF